MVKKSSEVSRQHLHQARLAGARLTDHLLDFVCVGPTRTGTTWLHNALGSVASLPGPHVKETYFFDAQFDRGVEWYRSHFRVASGTLIGEFAPTYFHSALARRRLHALAPDCRIICILRDPVARLFSHYKMRLLNGTIRASFEEAVYADPEMLSSSCYSRHLQGWMNQFGRAKVKVLLFDALLADPAGTLGELCSFIDCATPPLIERANVSANWFLPKNPRLARLCSSLASELRLHRYSKLVMLAKQLGIVRKIVRRQAPMPSLDPVVEQRLRAEFGPEVEALEALLGRDLSCWKTPSAAPTPDLAASSLR